MLNDLDSENDAMVQGYRNGFRIIFLVLAGLAAASTLLVVFLMPHTPLDRDDDDKLKLEGKARVAADKGGDGGGGA